MLFSYICGLRVIIYLEKKQKQKEKKEGGLHTPCLIVYGLDLSANWTGTRLRFKFTIGLKIRKKKKKQKIAIAIAT